MKGKFEKITGKSFDNPDETRRPFEKGKIDVITVGGLPFYRETLAPGWQWSKHVKPVVGGNSCQRFHVKIFLAGRQRVRMDDGTEMEFGPGDVAVMHPGHDAWVVGDEANVLIELADIVKMPADVPEETLTKITLEAVRRFNEAINRHDVDAVMAAMTEDCVFENTYPPRMAHVMRARRPSDLCGSDSLWPTQMRTLRLKRCLLLLIAVLFDGFTERRKKEGPGICAAWMCFVCGTGR
nr:nuclear transport factor 2 family protein [Thermus caldilimi]